MDIQEMTKEGLEKLVSNTDYHRFGLPVIEIDDGYYAIAFNDEEADSAVHDCISENLWAFNEIFLAEQTGIDLKVFVAFSTSNLCESANEAIKCLVEQTCGIDTLVEAVIDADGRGHFLALYDGEEIELDCGAYAYQID